MLERPKLRSRMERDLVKRDLRFLDRFAFFKTRYLPSAVVDRAVRTRISGEDRPWASPDDPEGLVRCPWSVARKDRTETLHV